MTQTLVDRWYAAVRAGDANALADVVCDDVVLLWNGDPGRLPWAGTHSGADAVLAFFRTLAQHIDVVSITPLYRLTPGTPSLSSLKGTGELAPQIAKLLPAHATYFASETAA